MNEADEAIVYYNPHTIAHKKLAAISKDEVKQAFGRKDLIVLDSSAELQSYLTGYPWKGEVLLMMSSGTFDGINLPEFAKKIAGDEPAISQ